MHDDCQRPGGMELTLRGLALCDFAPCSRLVDVGCGLGDTVRLLRERGHKAVGVDPHAQSPGFPSSCSPSFPLISARAQALPLARESMQGVLCQCVLSLCGGAAAILRGFGDICRPGARLLLSDIYLSETRESPAAGGGELFSRPEMEKALRDAGWNPLFFEDHSRSLKVFAAQLLWRDAEIASHALCGKAFPWRRCGYGLWIAQKEGV